MARRIRDAKLQTNHGGDASARPELPSEAVGFGALVQHSGQAGKLLVGQPARGPRWWPAPEGLRAPLPGSRHPLADGRFADTQGCGDLALEPALLLELPGL
jgi:hypothetical protein